MINLTEKIIDYKKSKYQEVLNEIFKLLRPILKEKSDFIFFKKWYPNNMYTKCKYCQDCKHNKELEDKLKELKRREHCENCIDCICNKGYFNLKNNNLCEYEDVEQDLNLEILRLIDDFDIKSENFNTYLFSSLWDWCPNFITLDFIENANHSSLFRIDEEGEEQNLDIEDEKGEKKLKSNLHIEDILNECKTENERTICELYLGDFAITEEEIGKKIGMTKQNISLILKELRKRLKKYLTK